MSDRIKLCHAQEADIKSLNIVNWNMVQQNAFQQRVSGDIFYRFNEQLPANVRDEFKQHWLGQTVAALIYQNELTRLASAFEEHKISPVILKGPALQTGAYDDPGQRPITDLDLLISPKELPKMKEILSSHGYQYEDDIPWEANCHKQNWIYPQGEGQSPLRIELHTRLFAKEPKDLKWKFEDYTIAPYRTLQLTDNLVFLIGHLAYQHTFARLWWLIDIDRLLRKNGNVDWVEFENKVKLLRIENSTGATLFALLKILRSKIEVPSKFLNKHIHRRVWKYLLSADFLEAPKKFPIRYYLLKHFLKRSFLEALRYDFFWLINMVRHKVS